MDIGNTKVSLMTTLSWEYFYYFFLTKLYNDLFLIFFISTNKVFGHLPLALKWSHLVKPKLIWILSSKRVWSLERPINCEAYAINCFWINAIGVGIIIYAFPHTCLEQLLHRQGDRERDRSSANSWFCGEKLQYLIYFVHCEWSRSWSIKRSFDFPCDTNVTDFKAISSQKNWVAIYSPVRIFVVDPRQYLHVRCFVVSWVVRRTHLSSFYVIDSSKCFDSEIKNEMLVLQVSTGCPAVNYVAYLQSVSLPEISSYSSSSEASFRWKSWP